MRLLRPFRGLFGLATRTRRSLSLVPDVLESILVLPTMAQQLAQIERNTRTLPGVLEALEGVKADTAVLPGMERQLIVTNSGLALLREDTEQLALHVPKLVVMETSLPAMVPLLQEVDRSVARLADLAEPLEGAAERIGRLSDRLPARRVGSRRRIGS